MGWQPKRTNARKRWQHFLTPDEERTLKEIDAAKKHWQQLNIQRAVIVNRAIKRAAAASTTKKD